MPMPFRQCMDALSKSPAAAHGLAGRSPASAEEGRLLLWLLSLGDARESDSVAEGERNAFDRRRTHQSARSPPQINQRIKPEADSLTDGEEKQRRPL